MFEASLFSQSPLSEGVVEEEVEGQEVAVLQHTESPSGFEVLGQAGAREA